MTEAPKINIGELTKAGSKSLLAGALFALGGILVQKLWQEATEYFENLETKGETEQPSDQPQA